MRSSLDCVFDRFSTHYNPAASAKSLAGYKGLAALTFQMNIPPSKAAAPTDADLAAIGQSLGALPLRTLKIILVRTCTCAL